MRTVYPKGEKLSKESVDEAFNDESPAISYSSETAFSDKEITPNPQSPGNSNSELYIGGATETEAEKRIEYSGFVVYYRMPEDGSVSYSLPLMLAYRSSHGEFFHFPISQSKQFDNHGKMKRSMYRVEFDDFSLGSSENRRLIPGFFSLEALIKHYKTFAYHNAEKGILETFPIKNKRNSKN
ncbi:unnamed protein product [Caenorhabditis nigoni]